MEVVGEEMVGEHDCWKIKVYSPQKDSNFEVIGYSYQNKKNLRTWKDETSGTLRNLFYKK